MTTGKTKAKKPRIRLSYKWITNGLAPFAHSRSGHGLGWTPFSYASYLPKQVWDAWRPGRWLPKVESLSMCSNGYHVTDTPIKFQKGWWHKLTGAQLYLVEVRGEHLTAKFSQSSGNKSCWQEIRLLRPVTPSELRELRKLQKERGSMHERKRILV